MASPGRPSSRSRAPPPASSSLEAALDEERRQVMAALEGQRTSSPSSRKIGNAAPPAPVRSMLDIDSPTPRHGSIAGIGVGITAGASPPQPRRKRSLDPADPSSWTGRHTSLSPTTSPTEQPNQGNRQRSTSDLGKLPQGLPKVPEDKKKDFDQDYRFDMSPSASTHPEPKRVTQGGKNAREGTPQAMAAALSGDFSSLHVGLPRGATSGRHNSTAGIGGKSRSPSSRIVRTDSPKPRLLNPNIQPAKYRTEGGKVIDMKSAYRRLSDKSGGSFSTITSGSEEGARVEKDMLMGEDDAAIESSEEEYHTSSSDEDVSDLGRGRRRGRRKKSIGSEAECDETEEADSAPDTRREARSQMAAAEQERIAVSSTQPVKSLLDPLISVTGPSGENVAQRKAGVHPNNAFDEHISVATSQASSDMDPEFADISKARKLGLNVSSVDTNVPDRAIQIILRGDWASLQQEADDGRRTQRMYLVASDLSDEAVYALEWTIGTILRDGDTLLAIYAIEDERAGGKTAESEHDAMHAEGANAGRHAEEAMESLTKHAEQHAYLNTTFQPATESGSVAGSVDARRVSKAEMDRLRAVDSIANLCLKLLRKTRLQVRVMVEVIHCKSPKHLITGAIDELEPTLVVLGSRGRSALKGVLLGSFSNYLVTKSSVPVMVARRKLRKHSKVHSSQIRLTNNLQTPNSGRKTSGLRNAKIERNPSAPSRK